MINGVLNSPYGYMMIGEHKFINGEKVINQKLVDEKDEHLVPSHWITTKRRDKNAYL